MWLTNENFKIASAFAFKVLKTAKQFVYRLDNYRASLAAKKKKYCHLKQKSLKMNNFAYDFKTAFAFFSLFLIHLLILAITKQVIVEITISTDIVCVINIIFHCLTQVVFIFIFFLE